MANLARILTDSVERDAAAPALRLDDLVLSYHDLDGASARAAAFMEAHGVAEGDQVAIMLPNVPQFAVLYYGALRLGAVVVPMNPLLKAREVEYYLGDSGARLLFAADLAAQAAAAGAKATGAEAVIVDLTGPGFATALGRHDPQPGVADRADDDTAVILYTSGTTGTPKGAELTHHNLCRNAEITARTLAEVSAADVVLGALPLFHVFGQTCGLNAAILSGACLTMVPRFDATKVLQVLQDHRVTTFEGVPTMFTALLHHPKRESYDVSALRLCVSGGAAIPVEVLFGFEEAFGVEVLEGYGLSETSPVASFNHPHTKRKPGSIGTPIEGVEMRVVDSEGNDVPRGERGEIVVRGHNVMKGYWNRPEATREAIRDGWFHTGDVGTIDSEGFFAIVDRTKDMIIRGGYNVYPSEIEEVLHEHPAVAEAAVVGVPHPTHGEEVAAAVVLKPDASASPQEIREHARSRVAAYKYPRHVWITDSLPKGPTGKILKREIRLPEEALQG